MIMEVLRTPFQPSMSWVQIIRFYHKMVTGHLRLGHLILNWKHNADSLKSKDGCPEKDWELFWTCEPGNRGGAGDGSGKDVVEDDAKTSKLQDVCQDRAGREIPQVLDAADEDHRNQEDSNVEAVVPVKSEVGLHNLGN